MDRALLEKLLIPIETLEPITVWIHYDRTLQTITGTDKEWAIVNNGSPFGLLFNNLLSTYPEILIRYPPNAGVLGFNLNGQPPQFGTALCEDDVIHLGIYGPTPYAPHTLS